jgi:hypothetical protein
VKVDFLPVLCQFVWGVGVGDMSYINPTSAMNIDNSGSRASIFAKVSSERERGMKIEG